jgi:DNA-binding NtrC family response regulator
MDDATLDPRTTRRVAAKLPVLVRVFGPTGASSERCRLAEGETAIGRKVGEGQIALDDPRASRLHARVTRKGRAVEVHNESQHGTFVNGARVEQKKLSHGDVLRAGDTLFVLCEEPPLFDAPQEARGMIGTNAVLEDTRQQIELVGPTDATVLVRGASGTGKEVAARAIHAASGRGGPLVAVNCGAIPEQLAESQLFGHKAGAFTGANADHPGFFTQAEGGTLFLDEIAELTPLLQPKLLRVLDNKEVMPVGSTKPTTVDVRIVAASHRDLEGWVDEERFRGDLYARISEVTLTLPPLRERREDIALLFERSLMEGHAPVDPLLIEQLLLYRWPFNVRELKKLATELSIMGQGRDEIGADLLGDRLASPAAGFDEVSNEEAPDRDGLVDLLRAHKGVVTEVAKAAGRSRKQVYRWLKRYDLNPEDYR